MIFGKICRKIISLVDAPRATAEFIYIFSLSTDYQTSYHSGITDTIRNPQTIDYLPQTRSNHRDDDHKK